eukprot:4483276-Alexandrium_andersonii.AAC.1
MLIRVAVAKSAGEIVVRECLSEVPSQKAPAEPWPENAYPSCRRKKRRQNSGPRMITRVAVAKSAGET